MLLPTPHKNTPLFARRSASFRLRISGAFCPASTPKRVQQKAAGRFFINELVMRHYSCLSIFMQDIETEVQRLMRENGLTQSAVASKLGISQSTVSRYVRRSGKRTGPARRRAAAALTQIHNREDGYSSTGASRNLVEKLIQMCESDEDVALLGSLLDLVAAYRRRTRS
jgi:predicted transcriptional regulator